MDSSDKERGERGVTCSLLRMSDGHLRVVLDDVRNLAPGESGPWRHEVFVTFKDYEQAELSSLDLSEEELAAFGHYVLARLLAINGLLPSEP
ncbi:hypothetical protein [Dyella mobilis]|uniref:Uncharacterized protein n=1 Tax=Dyella mobilis TaxID=1849582 RepID=A0ABS2KIN5_9GAMM|nr:hypothetical protein [Dyella mobilis]MBM7130783.1 hypothetical protein [Dyella mobilis]GLQ97410.1 hypothetical protein GCM10007863_18300 [Dyella mobilis]